MLTSTLIDEPSKNKVHVPQFFENKPYLNYKEAAQYLSLSVPYLRRLKQQKEIPFVEHGRAVRFRVSSLNSWVEKREIK